MFAVIETGGKQYIVEENTIIDIEKIETSENTPVTFDKVLLLNDGKDTQIGQPYLEGVTVEASVLEELKDSKKIVFKFKPKTGYKKKTGHRQQLTRVRITKLNNKKAAKA